MFMYLEDLMLYMDIYSQLRKFVFQESLLCKKNLIGKILLTINVLIILFFMITIELYYVLNYFIKF